MDDDPLTHAETQLRELRSTWAYAFANAHGCTYGSDDSLAWVHEREATLMAIISEYRVD
jgi:hypothetical protein